VSTLDSTIRLMDKSNGAMLQSFAGHVNKDFRMRSCLGLADSVVVSGSEDGHLYAWDLLQGSVVERIKAHGGKVVSAVAFNQAQKEWASAGTDGELDPRQGSTRLG
jgi:mitogen-activated protein kinase organizer 1